MSKQPIKLTAEARQMSDTTINAESQAELAMIEEDITNAINKSKYRIGYCHKKFTNQTIRELKRLGYNIEEYDSQKEGYSIEISW